MVTSQAGQTISSYIIKHSPGQIPCPVGDCPVLPQVRADFIDHMWQDHHLSLRDIVGSDGAVQKVEDEVKDRTRTEKCPHPGCAKGPFRTYNGLLIHMSKMHPDGGRPIPPPSGLPEAGPVRVVVRKPDSPLVGLLGGLEVNGQAPEVGREDRGMGDQQSEAGGDAPEVIARVYGEVPLYIVKDLGASSVRPGPDGSVELVR